MIVERWTFKVKAGCRDKLVKVLKSENAPSWPNRVLTCMYGTRGRVVVESEWEDFATLEKAWSEWARSPGRMQHREAIQSLTEGDTVSEIWRVHS